MSANGITDGAFGSSPVPENPFRTCLKCGNDKIITAFPTGEGNKVCLECTGGYHSKALRLRKQQRASQVRTLVSALQQRNTAPHISQLCESMIALYGGVENFALFWKEQIDEAVERMPGSKTVLDNIYGIVKLVNMSSQHTMVARDIANMSNEELELEIAALMPRVLQIECDDESGPVSDSA